MPDITVDLRGARGESLAALARRVGVAAPDATDEEAMVAGLRSAVDEYLGTNPELAVVTPAAKDVLDDVTTDAMLETLEYTPAGGSAGRSVRRKLRESISVADYGASPDATAGENTVAFQAAIDAASDGRVILVEGGEYAVNDGELELGGKRLIFQLDGASINGSIQTNLPALVRGWDSSRLNLVRWAGASATDGFDEFRLRAADYTGGTPGFVNCGLWQQTIVGEDAAAFEWNAVFRLDNSAEAGENVALYAQANVATATAGPTWAGVFELHEKTVAGNPATGRVTLEVNHFASGTDANNNRVVLHVVGGTNFIDVTGTPAKPVIARGIWITPFNGALGQVWFENAIEINAEFENGLRIVGMGTAETGIALDGALMVGVDTSSADIDGHTALRMASAQRVAWEATDTIRSGIVPFTNRVGYYNGATERVGIDANATTPGVFVNGTKVVGAQLSAIAALTGAETLEVTQDRINQILVALRTHGLIAT